MAVKRTGQPGKAEPCAPYASPPSNRNEFSFLSWASICFLPVTCWLLTPYPSKPGPRWKCQQACSRGTEFLCLPLTYCGIKVDFLGPGASPACTSTTRSISPPLCNLLKGPCSFVGHSSGWRPASSLSKTLRSLQAKTKPFPSHSWCEKFCWCLPHMSNALYWKKLV